MCSPGANFLVNVLLQGSTSTSVCSPIRKCAPPSVLSYLFSFPMFFLLSFCCTHLTLSFFGALHFRCLFRSRRSHDLASRYVWSMPCIWIKSCHHPPMLNIYFPYAISICFVLVFQLEVQIRKHWIEKLSCYGIYEKCFPDFTASDFGTVRPQMAWAPEQTKF